MANIFGTEHLGSFIEFPPNGEQHTFHLRNGVVVSAVKSDATRGQWEICAWREHTSRPVLLDGVDGDGIVGGLTEQSVGEKLREAAAIETGAR